MQVLLPKFILNDPILFETHPEFAV